MGISATQGRFLAERLHCNTDKEAAEKIGIKPQSVAQWKIDYPEFKAMYENLGNDGVNIALEILRQNLGQAAMVVVEAMQAKDARGKCDHIARMNAARLAMQAHGLLKEKREVDLKVSNADELVSAFQAAAKRNSGDDQPSRE